jgi:hypothetical protein
MSNAFIRRLEGMSTNELVSYSKTVSTLDLNANTDLLKMSLADLQAYSTSLANRIDNDTIKIQQSQRQQNLIANRILLSQSTSYGYRQEIINNNNRLLAYNTQYREIIQNNSTVDGNIEVYKTRIDDNITAIKGFNNLIGGLQIRASSISTTLQGSSFEERAKYYSSLYMKYMVAEALYTDCVNSTIQLNSVYNNYVKVEEEAYSNLLTSADDVLKNTTEITRLYKDKVIIHSTLTDSKIKEVLYTNAYDSTTAGVTAVKGLLDIATLFNNYNELALAQQKNMQSYSTAYSYYTALDMTNNTISGATSAGWLSFMSTLSSTESTINANMSNTSNSINTRIAASEITWISTANAAVDINEITTSTLNAYVTLAKSSLEYNSTLNDDANTRLVNNTNAYLQNMSDYTDNINTSNYIVSSINVGSNLEASMIISRMNKVPQIREALLSTYARSVEYSTIMGNTYEAEINDYNYYSDIYDSTNKSIFSVNSLLTDVTTSTYNTIAKLNTLSTMLDMADINMEVYKIEGQINYNMEELEAMKYRQAYIISKRVDAKKIYENCVLTQVQQVQQLPGGIIVPAAVNLAADSIAIAYTNLNTVNTFLNRFALIYDNHAAHMGNLYTISTLVGNKVETYSSLTTYRQQSYLNLNDTFAANALTAAQTTLQRLTSLVESSTLILKASQSIIENDKINFMNNYVNTFPASEVIRTESTISSFLEAGFLMPSQ